MFVYELSGCGSNPVAVINTLAKTKCMLQTLWLNFLMKVATSENYLTVKNLKASKVLHVRKEMLMV